MTRGGQNNLDYAESRMASGIQVSGSDMTTRKNRRIQSRRDNPNRDLPKIALTLVILILIVVALALSAAILHIIDLSRAKQETPEDTRPPLSSPLAGSTFSWDADRPTFLESGAVASTFGIDVSEWNTATVWDEVAADGVTFALIRIGYRGETEGSLYEDELFEEAYAAATAANIPVGLYFFSTAKTAREAREEADFLLELLDGRPLDLPIAWDHESYNRADTRCYGMTAEDYSLAAAAFCNRIEHAGYTAMIYGNRGAIAMLSDEVRARYSIWLAEWDVDAPTVGYPIVFWQYTSKGTVAGIWRNVDCSIRFTEAVIATPATRKAAYDAAVAAGEIIRTDVDELADSVTDLACSAVLR